MPEKLYIKNMVCDRCIMAVDHELRKTGISFQSILLGEVILNAAPGPEELKIFRESVSKIGFELIEDKTMRIVSHIKNAAIQYIRDGAGIKKYKFSAYLSGELNKDYNYLSNLFSKFEGITIEQYLINQKIESVKELLGYDELSLSEIASDLGYSSLQHLSNQFKKVTGSTPTHFRKIKENFRKSLDKV